MMKTPLPSELIEPHIAEAISVMWNLVRGKPEAEQDHTMMVVLRTLSTFANSCNATHAVIALGNLKQAVMRADRWPDRPFKREEL